MLILSLAVRRNVIDILRLSGRIWVFNLFKDRHQRLGKAHGDPKAQRQKISIFHGRFSFCIILSVALYFNLYHHFTGSLTKLYSSQLSSKRPGAISARRTRPIQRSNRMWGKMKSIRLRLRNQRVDPEMWVQLYDSYLRRFALLKIKNAEIAEDLVQETFLAALTSLADFQRRSSVKTWLTGILRNKIMDYYRRSQRELAMENKDLAIISLDEISGGHEHWCAWSNRINYNPANFFEQMEFFEVLNRCLAELPIRLAYIFILHTFLSLSTIEICRELNISKTNCWVMLHRARRLLKVLLQARWISV